MHALILCNLISPILASSKVVAYAETVSLAAHSDYDNDERITQIIANGLGKSTIFDEVKNRCEWLQTQ